MHTAQGAGRDEFDSCAPCLRNIPLNSLTLLLPSGLPLAEQKAQLCCDTAISDHNSSLGELSVIY